MQNYFKLLRLLGDASRVRLLRLLCAEELSVAELQEILGMGQSRISMQLSQLKQAGLVEARRAGQKSLYSLGADAKAHPIVMETLRRGGEEIPAAAQDDAALGFVLQNRKDRLRSYFDEVAGRFGRHYVPGRSWKALTEMFLKLLPPVVVADLGAGEGAIALLLAQRARKVIAVDNSQKMRDYATDLAKKHGVDNLDYRVGDLEELPVADGEADLAIFHQSLHHALHPAQAMGEAARILRPGGRVAVLDLLKHGFEEVRDLYSDVWLGFSQVELTGLLENAGLLGIAVSVVDRESEAPHFETVLAVGEKPAGTSPQSAE